MKTMTEEDIKTYHPLTIQKLTMPDGTVRYPYYDEWFEDFGLGYFDKMAKLGNVDSCGNIINH